jgi:hypothetical protein
LGNVEMGQERDSLVARHGMDFTGVMSSNPVSGECAAGRAVR